MVHFRRPSHIWCLVAKVCRGHFEKEIVWQMNRSSTDNFLDGGIIHDSPLYSTCWLVCVCVRVCVFHTYVDNGSTYSVAVVVWVVVVVVVLWLALLQEQ